ncbi:hypothetical protein GOP47_0008509 [Adiantum capillus-veneris]|uniref:Uncharacterized protein n=1 Tax=Adiantum capillus-veneris TaxID=13818 RepID=A0A9D4UYP9_ADICA|nr:hypothetical protein GOP47_0008509 [Adiantum capillus-veneris]
MSGAIEIFRVEHTLRILLLIHLFHGIKGRGTLKESLKTSRKKTLKQLLAVDPMASLELRSSISSSLNGSLYFEYKNTS